MGLELECKNRSVVFGWNGRMPTRTPWNGTIDSRHRFSARQGWSTGSVAGAVLAALWVRDGAMDGRFYYSVRTTGVYCRPSVRRVDRGLSMFGFMRPAWMRSRRGSGLADVAGLMGHQRSSGEAANMVRICRLIEQADHVPPSVSWQRTQKLSPPIFIGSSPPSSGSRRGVPAAQRAKRLRQELERGRSVTAAMYDAGFESSGRFYAAAPALLGMAPSQYRAGGAQTELWFAVGDCSLGAVLVAQSPGSVPFFR